MMKTAPLALFAYKRLESLEQTVTALAENYLAKETDLIIFSDGPKSADDVAKVSHVREYLKTISSFRSVKLEFSAENKGLARSIRSGVSKLLELHDSVIVLEDDLVTSRNFLDFMNAALKYYRSRSGVFAISGFNFPYRIKDGDDSDVYFNPRGCSWGWATWADRWKAIDWTTLRNGHQLSLPTRQLGDDFPSLMRKHKNATVDSWAVPWCYDAFSKGLLCVYPKISKVKSVGFDSASTHTVNLGKRFATVLDSNLNRAFRFEDDIFIDPFYHKQFLRKFSNYERIKWRVYTDIIKVIKN